MILKIQLLRLVHNFCSHSTFKHVLLSYNEMDELKQLYVAFESPTLPNTAVTSPSSSSASTSSGVAATIANLPYCTGGAGLLSKIIRVLKTVPTSSIFRYFVLHVNCCLYNTCHFWNQILAVPGCWELVAQQQSVWSGRSAVCHQSRSFAAHCSRLARERIGRWTVGGCRRPDAPE